MMEIQVPLSLLVPACVVLAGVALALIADAFERASHALWLIVATLVVGGAAAWWLSYGAGIGESPIFIDRGGFVRFGALGYLLTAAAVAAGHTRFSPRERGVAMAALMALGAVFAQALLASLDLIVFFVTLAGLAVVAYALIAGAGTRRAEESAVRYFVQGTVASGLTVYGLALLLGLGDGQTSYLMPFGESGATRPVMVAMGLMASVLAFKIGAFPFHSWVPDAYETADPPVAAYLGSVPKLAGVVALVVLGRLTIFSDTRIMPMTEVLTFLAIGSLLFGAFGMLAQRSVARMLGYSAIAQVGYALMGLAGGATGVNAAVVHIALYAIGACAAFVALEAVMRLRPAWDGSVGGLAGLSRQAPFLSAGIVVVMLSLTGIPLFAGFWGKFLTLLAAVQGDLVWLAIVAGVAAVASFGGYGAVIRWMYFHGEDAPEAVDEGARAGVPGLVLLLLAAVLVVIGVMPLALGMQQVYALFGV